MLARGLLDDGRPTQQEIDGDQGATVRFGDGVFGAPPAAEDLFDVSYRVGLGAEGNVAADSITAVDPAWSALVASARNPFQVTDGADAESAARAAHGTAGVPCRAVSCGAAGAAAEIRSPGCEGRLPRRQARERPNTAATTNYDRKAPRSGRFLGIVLQGQLADLGVQPSHRLAERQRPCRYLARTHWPLLPAIAPSTP